MIDASYDMQKRRRSGLDRMVVSGLNRVSVGTGTHLYGQGTALIRAVASACLAIADCYQ